MLLLPTDSEMISDTSSTSITQTDSALTARRLRWPISIMGVIAIGAVILILMLVLGYTLDDDGYNVSECYIKFK